MDPFQINLSGDFHQQLDTILATIRLTQEEATAISSLYVDVERVLQAIWPGEALGPYGLVALKMTGLI